MVQAESDTNAALDTLTDPAKAEALQLAAFQTAADVPANAAAAEQLAVMGFKRRDAERALQQGRVAGDVSAALDLLRGWGCTAYEPGGASAAEGGMHTAPHSTLSLMVWRFAFTHRN